MRYHQQKAGKINDFRHLIKLVSKNNFVLFLREMFDFEKRAQM